MKTKILVTALLMLFCLHNATAQSHKVGQANYNCKLNKKGWFFNSEKHPCPACQAKEDKEKNAKEAEDKRRMDAHNAKVLADKKAEEARISEKIRLAKEEEQRKKDKEAADIIAREKAIKKYKEIAANGLVKSNAKGQASDIDLSQVKAFEDKNRKVYGFKINDEEVMTFPFDDESMNISRVADSNLFEVNVWGKNNRGYSRYKYSYLIDYTGKRIIVDGVDRSIVRVSYNKEDKVIYFYKNLSIEVTDRIVDSLNKGVGNFHKTKESAIADVNLYSRAGLCMCDPEWIYFDTRYVLDYNGNLLEKSDGYTVRGGED